MPELDTPLQWLAYLERQCLDCAHALPQKEEGDDDWIGIGFRLGEYSLVAPLGEVAEILTPPSLSRVPRTREWVCGIANVRGNLMPIMDLQAYLYERPASLNRRSRILVVNHQGVYAGLVVDAVMGLRHFQPEERCEEIPVDDERLRPYLRHGFRAGGELWGVFSMFELAETPQFLQAAV
ncbi:MAG TPA: purine-binding chemotaxis protein CheW [Gammaproteobacteria bacterium]|nr:purine-binding chemotaxis protein CheW [Gammaproteobacteria bacterium]